MIVERDFPDHPKTVKLCRLLGSPGAPLLVLRIWAHCEQRRTDELPRDPEDIAAICRWDGPAKKLVNALLTCRWLDEAEHAFIAHGWRERNASWLAKIEGGKKRASQARRNAAGQLTQAATLEGTQPASQLAGGVLGQQSSSSPVSAGSRAGAVEWSGVEYIPPIVPQGGQGEQLAAVAGQNLSTSAHGSAEKKETGAAAIVLEEAKRRICGLFGRQSLFFGHDAERALADLQRAGVLPLHEEDWRLLAWWFGLPKDERDSDLRNRRQHAETLACNLLAEIDRARGYAKKTSAAEAPKKNGGAVDLERLHAWFAPQWPDMPLPRSLEDLPEYLRDEARRACTPQPVTA